MPYVNKDQDGTIISGKFANFQEGIAEHFITEAEWQTHLSQSSNQDLIISPVQKLFRAVQSPSFPWAVFYEVSRQSVEFNAMLTLLLTGLQSGFSPEFISTRFKEMTKYLRDNPELPQLTTAHQTYIRQAVIDAGLNEQDFF